MNRYLNLLLLPGLLAVAAPAAAQSPVRPYSEWEATQFVALNGHQPSDYVVPDNNWEIVYNLRTPHTLAELRRMGVECSDSQLLLLEVGGLIRKTEGRWETMIPILDEQQTVSLREFGSEVAESVYGKTKTDFAALVDVIGKMGFRDNSLSLVFSYLLDGRMWTKLVLFEDINNNTTWSGCYWVLYEPRKGVACGTNSYGEQDLILTYVDSGIALGDEVMERYAAEISRYGKVTDAGLLRELQPYGLADAEGNVTIPIIRKQPDDFHRLTDKLVGAISAELKDNCVSLASRYGIGDEKTAMVVLYHEVMWDLLDKLIRDKLISIPPIFADRNAHKFRLNDVLFFVEGGLMQ